MCGRAGSGAGSGAGSPREGRPPSALRKPGSARKERRVRTAAGGREAEAEAQRDGAGAKETDPMAKAEEDEDYLLIPEDFSDGEETEGASRAPSTATASRAGSRPPSAPRAGALDRPRSAVRFELPSDPGGSPAG